MAGFTLGQTHAGVSEDVPEGSCRDFPPRAPFKCSEDQWERQYRNVATEAFTVRKHRLFSPDLHILSTYCLTLWMHLSIYANGININTVLFNILSARVKGLWSAPVPSEGGQKQDLPEHQEVTWLQSNIDSGVQNQTFCWNRLQSTGERLIWCIWHHSEILEVPLIFTL